MHSAHRRVRAAHRRPDGAPPVRLTDCEAWTHGLRPQRLADTDAPSTRRAPTTPRPHDALPSLCTARRSRRRNRPCPDDDHHATTVHHASSPGAETARSAVLHTRTLPSAQAPTPLGHGNVASAPWMFHVHLPLRPHRDWSTPWRDARARARHIAAQCARSSHVGTNASASSDASNVGVQRASRPEKLRRHPCHRVAGPVLLATTRALDGGAPIPIRTPRPKRQRSSSVSGTRDGRRTIHGRHQGRAVPSPLQDDVDARSAYSPVGAHRPEPDGRGRRTALHIPVTLCRKVSDGATTQCDARRIVAGRKPSFDSSAKTPPPLPASTGSRETRNRSGRRPRVTSTHRSRRPSPSPAGSCGTNAEWTPGRDGILAPRTRERLRQNEQEIRGRRFERSGVPISRPLRGALPRGEGLERFHEAPNGRHASRIRWRLARYRTLL